MKEQRFPNDFERGYVCAVANILKLYDENEIARDVLNQISPSTFDFSKIVSADKDVIIKSRIYRENNVFFTYRDVCYRKGKNEEWVKKNVTLFNPDINLGDLSIAESGFEEGRAYTAYVLSSTVILMVFEQGEDRIDFVDNQDGRVDNVILRKNIG